MYIDKIPDDAKQISNSRDYVDPRGNVYGIETRHGKNMGKPFMKTQSSVYGYKYVGINYNDGRHVTKRVHKLVAEAFIPNPENLPIVLHRNNDKTDNNVDNLKWGTTSENTQQAFDDCLAFNESGFSDSQSYPCECYDTLTNELVDIFGSVSEAEIATGITKSGILYQLNNPDKPIRKQLYFVPFDQGPREHDIIVMRDMKTDEIVQRFTTIGKAESVTGIPSSTISFQVKNGKPKWSKEGVYFERIGI